MDRSSWEEGSGEAFVDGPGLGWQEPPDFMDEVPTAKVETHTTKCLCGEVVPTVDYWTGAHECEELR